LIVGSVLGLSQLRIKRVFAYSTISHIGFILLALSINSIESIQAFIFYLMQYSISNLNAFIILISIGFSLFYYIDHTDEYKKLTEKDSSPIQLINQLKGYFYINPVLALSLAITIFSFVGIPPLIGFFAKQIIFSAALDSGYVFMAILAVLTSVISAVYYLNIIKKIFFDTPNTVYSLKEEVKTLKLEGKINDKNVSVEKFTFKVESIVLSSYLSNVISILSLVMLSFLFIPHEIIKMTNILSICLSNL